MAKKIINKISAVLMLFITLPMLLWCWGLIDNAALDYDYAGAGCFVAGIIYIFSILTAIFGLIFAWQKHRHHCCKVFAYIQLAMGVLLVYPLRSYTVLMLLPLFILTVLYLFSLGWREKQNNKQQ